MTDDLLELRVVSAREHLVAALDPAPPAIGNVRGRQRGRRRLGAVAAVAVVAASMLSVVRLDDADRSDVIAGESATTAALLAPGEVQALPPSPLAGRSTMASVWTGTEMLLWGGDTPVGQMADGAGFDPRTGEWRLLPEGPLSARNAPAAAWTGSEMLLWGGSSSDGDAVDGAAFDPESNEWRPIADAPFASAGRPTAVWSGTEMLVFAGFNSRSVAAYDPAADRWRSLPELPRPLLAPNPTVTWTGTELVAVTIDGAIVALEPSADSWSTLPAFVDPVALAWTGTTLLAVGRDLAAVLDAENEAWDHFAERPAELSLGDVVTAWTGTLLLTWDGLQASVIDPVARVWHSTPAAVGGGSLRIQPAAVWADGVFLAWGGFASHADGVMLRPRSLDSTPVVTEFGFPPLTPLFTNAPTTVIGDTTVIDTPDVTLTVALAPDKLASRLEVASLPGTGAMSAHPMEMPAISWMSSRSPDGSPTETYLSGITRAEIVRLDVVLHDQVVTTVDTVAHTDLPALRFFVVRAPDGIDLMDVNLRAYDNDNVLLTDTHRIKAEEPAFFAAIAADGATARDVQLGARLAAFARAPSDETFDSLPFADGSIRLLWNGEPFAADTAGGLRDPAAWHLDNEQSALSVLAVRAQEQLSFSPGPYALCATTPTFDLVPYDEHVIIEPAAIDTCAEWFGIDLYLAAGRIVAVNLQTP